MLLVNIHKPTEALQVFIQRNKSHITRIIDFSGLLNVDGLPLDTLKDLNHSQKILETGTKHYLEFSGELSRERFNKRSYFRDLHIDELPIYWLTNLGIKYPYRFYFRNLFILQARRALLPNALPEKWPQKNQREFGT